MLKSIAVVCLLAVPALGAEPVALRYKFDAGEPVRFEVTQTMQQSQTMRGQTTETSSTMTNRVVTELLGEKDGGSILIGHTTDSVKMSISAPGLELSYDSSDPDDRDMIGNPAVASAAALVGSRIELLIAPDGTVLDVPNIEQLQQTVAAMPDSAVRAGAQAMTREETLKAVHETNLRMLPGDAVEPGDSWERSFDIPFAGGEMTMDLDLTLDKVEDGLAHITIGGDMSMSDMVNQGVTVTLGDTDMSGTLVFNIADGVQERYDLRTEFNMTATAEGFPGPVFTSNMVQTMKMVRLDF